MPLVTALYAGILGLMSIALGVPIGRLRGKYGVSLGDGGHPDLLLAMRRHGNFMEWIPLTLTLLALLELAGIGHQWIHALGGALVIVRVFHAAGLQVASIQSLGRFVGAAGTALIVVIESIWLIVRYCTAG